jgi:hypothetical protein
VLPRARVHASIVAHIAAAHFCEHQPYYRLEKHLERLGVDLPRVCQVSLMAQLEERTRPLVTALQAQVFASGYIHLDATPIDLVDPGRPGAVRESTLWAYRATDGPVWFDFQLHKSPTSPAKALEKYRGRLQTDGASGLADIGEADGRVTHLGCFSHARRYLVKAVDAGELVARPYLRSINHLFRIERLARHFKLKLDNHTELRRRHSRPCPLRSRRPASARLSSIFKDRRPRSCAVSLNPGQESTTTRPKTAFARSNSGPSMERRQLWKVGPGGDRFDH